MIDVNSLRLGNGLQLLHHHDPSTQMVAVNILYDVGSRDERHGRTGMAHLFEHLMFGGTARIPNFDIPLQEAGGESNAWTTCDLTNFYEILPAQNIETAFWLESDRMASMTFSQQALDVQKGVVIEEFKQRCVNRPYGDVDHLLRSTTFTTHPYRWPTIGERFEDIENVTLDEVEAFFRAHYTPGNAILCVTGNIDFDRAVELVEKWFGEIPARSAKARNIPAEPLQSAPRMATVRRAVPQNMIIKAYHTCGRNDAGFPVCDIISDLLANGNSARFFRNILMETDLFSDLDAAVWGSIDPGLLVIKGKLTHGANIDKAIELIDAETAKLADGDVSQYEIEKYVNKLESKECFENISYAEKASKLCYRQLVSGDADDINREINEYRKITTCQIASEAAKLFDAANETTLLYGPDV